MQYLKNLTVGLLVLLAGMSTAHASCNKPPKLLAFWLKTHPRWYVTEEKHLGAALDDWKRLASPADRCPGFLSLNLDGSGRQSHIAMLRRDRTNGDFDEWLVLFRPHSSNAEILLRNRFSHGDLTPIIYRGEPDRDGRENFVSKLDFLSVAYFMNRKDLIRTSVAED